MLSLLGEKKKKPLCTFLFLSLREIFLSSASFREVAIEVSACYLKRRAKKSRVVYSALKIQAV